MGMFRASPARRLAVIGLLATLASAGIHWDEAEARPRKAPRQRVIHGPDYRPPYAAIVIDDKSGQVLHEESADEPRHPASLTKIMTLYLLFGELEAGRLKLDTPLPVSAQAALQRPTKLGLKAKQTIKVEDAIKGLVTKSANDAAVVVAEAIGGTEGEFAKLMTLKARGLGMTGTVYVNASGLPAADQITTARDQATLGRAIQHRFPRYYGYFATPSFQYRGAAIANHNKLLGQVKGVDGIKTGYTDASGYNLTSSVRRDGRHIVAVVLGGRSNALRDARMRQLIEEHISQGSLARTAPAIVEMVGQDPQQDTAQPGAANVVDAPIETVRVDTTVPAIPTPLPRPAAASGATPGMALASTRSDQVPASKPQQRVHPRPDAQERAHARPDAQQRVHARPDAQARVSSATVTANPPKRTRPSASSRAAGLDGSQAAATSAADRSHHVEHRFGPSGAE
jgi:D-alanyl-D-alanine carboxypeptidase